MSNGIFLFAHIPVEAQFVAQPLSNKLKHESIFRAKFDMRYQTWSMSHEHVTWCKYQRHKSIRRKELTKDCVG